MGDNNRGTLRNEVSRPTPPTNPTVDVAIQNGVPLVFLQESAIFGKRKIEKTEWLKHEEMFESLSKTIDPTHITGLQRVRGMWRIYLDNIDDKVQLLTRGIPIRGKTINVLKTNPLRFDGEQTTRIRIKDIPLSVDDGVLERVFIQKGVDCIGTVTREKLRINGKLTNCSTGDRLIIAKSSSITAPIPRRWGLVGTCAIYVE